MSPFPITPHSAATRAQLRLRRVRSHRPTWWRRIATVLAVLAGCGLFLGLTASPAAAHDRLKSSSPKPDAEVSGIERIVLEYTSHVRFPAVVLRGPGGAAAIGKPRLQGPKVLVDVTEPLGPGRYVIGWRVVSSDGHPIEGEIPFTVTASNTPAPLHSPAATSSPAASPTAAGTAAASSAPSATATPVAGSGPEAGSAGIPGWLWAAAVLVAIAAAVWISSRGGRRRHQNPTDPIDPEADPGPPTS
ncbi:copper resistance protein CopC [Streptosporangium sp. NBC_01639]|uniref:copper resistance CopC family protein n=1 Tax=Streptosporangium sp. NBC_01639 TaxID=2975948 RepID=UPI00386BCECB|nr:copper resistance protein CopC [Streptosporangium sp. NBC_01639]